ncbi:acylneuraminate cytidylyltransferase family protein [Marine Group I thaumarchaeote]|uniref:Acylneuraminate cytidylyltransferase family protein n=1 Tax=Marine Group I thaumarchaeote TaxID=2511932 RepID=A0A7K4MSD4_9ARCH|nr:acylneuraminate cytidylyltransferase family protein [Marine Group I thaumarchaeote]
MMITAFIPARGGSKGILGKNIKEFAGKPLIVHSIEYALNCSQIDEVVVSTDDDDIAKIARKAGARIVNRPPELSTDSAITESAIHHFVNKFNKKPDILVLLQPTSPYRPNGSLENAISHFTENGFDSLLSIIPTHRFFWRVKDDQTTYAEYDYLNRPRRQDLKQEDVRYMENGSLYIFTRRHFDKTGNRLGGKIGYVEWPEEYSLEIDTPLDFDILEKIFLSNSEK